LQTPALHPQRGGRNSPVRAVVVTSGDVDHIAGLLTLRERSPFDLFATQRVHVGLASDAVFRALANDVVRRRPMRLDEPCDTGIGITITPFSVPGKTPLYRETENVELGIETEDVIGLEILGPLARAIYIPSCARVTRTLLDRATDADALFFDGTTYTDDEMIALGVSEKSAARMGHLPIGGADGSLRALAGCRAARKIFIHLNNTNPVLVEGSDERVEVERNGWSVAYDGMVIDLAKEE
jgi:pyrroloquinoline quinone biosynthesis protein B